MRLHFLELDDEQYLAAQDLMADLVDQGISRELAALEAEQSIRGLAHDASNPETKSRHLRLVS